MKDKWMGWASSVAGVDEMPPGLIYVMPSGKGQTSWVDSWQGVRNYVLEPGDGKKYRRCRSLTTTYVPSWAGYETRRDDRWRWQTTNGSGWYGMAWQDYRLMSMFYTSWQILDIQVNILRCRGGEVSSGRFLVVKVISGSGLLTNSMS